MLRGSLASRPVVRPADPLDAVGRPIVWLRAPAAAGWADPDPWVNEGTGGSTFDAQVGDITPVLSGGKFRLWDETTDVTISGFELADDDLWNPTLNVDALTIAIDWQPLVDEDSKAFDHYDGDAIFESTGGYVLESLDFGAEILVATVFTAKADIGVGSFGNLNQVVDYSTARRLDVVRFDPSAGLLTFWRNGAKLVSSQPGDMSGLSSVAPAPGTPLRLTNTCDVWSFAAWDRALSDAEIATLDLGV